MSKETPDKVSFASASPVNVPAAVVAATDGDVGLAVRLVVTVLFVVAAVTLGKFTFANIPKPTLSETAVVIAGEDSVTLARAVKVIEPREALAVTAVAVLLPFACAVVLFKAADAVTLAKVRFASKSIEIEGVGTDALSEAKVAADPPTTLTPFKDAADDTPVTDILASKSILGALTVALIN